MLVIPLRDTQEAYEVTMHSAGIRLGTLCDAAQAEEQRDETQLKQAHSHGMCDCLICGGRADLKDSLAGSKAAATRDQDPCHKIVRLYAESIRAADGTEVARRELQRFP
jgi:hypothetical protein